MIRSLVVGGLFATAWACGGSNDQGGRDGSADEGAPDTGRDVSVKDAHHHDAPQDVQLGDSGSDVNPVDGGSDVHPIDGGSDVHPLDSGKDVHPSEGGADVRPLEAGFDVHPLDAPSDVIIADSPPDTPTDAPMIDAGASMTIATGESPQALAVDETHVYWENSGGPVLDCPVAGCPGNIPTLLAFNGYGFGLGSLAVGASTAFYLDSSSNIDSCVGAGCGLAPSVYDGVPDGSYSTFSSVVADSANLYFTDGRVVYSCPLGSTCSAPVALYTETSPSASVGSLAVSSTDVFFLRSGSFVDSLRSIPIAGGTSNTLCSTGSSGALSGVGTMVATASYVYFTTFFDSTGIYQCPVTGGTKPALYVTDVQPYGLAADGTFLYWTNNVVPGNVSACALGGSCASIGAVAKAQNMPGAIAVNSTTIFWTTSTAIYAALK